MDCGAADDADTAARTSRPWRATGIPSSPVPPSGAPMPLPRLAKDFCPAGLDWVSPRRLITPRSDVASSACRRGPHGQRRLAHSEDQDVRDTPPLRRIPRKDVSVSTLSVGRRYRATARGPGRQADCASPRNSIGRCRPTRPGDHLDPARWSCRAACRRDCRVDGRLHYRRASSRLRLLAGRGPPVLSGLGTGRQSHRGGWARP